MRTKSDENILSRKYVNLNDPNININIFDKFNDDMIKCRCRDESETEIHPKWSRTIYINIVMVVYLSIAKASITQTDTHTHICSRRKINVWSSNKALFLHPKKNKKMLPLYFFINHENQDSRRNNRGKKWN